MPTKQKVATTKANDGNGYVGTYSGVDFRVFKKTDSWIADVTGSDAFFCQSLKRDAVNALCDWVDRQNETIETETENYPETKAEIKRWAENIIKTEFPEVWKRYDFGMTRTKKRVGVCKTRRKWDGTIEGRIELSSMWFVEFGQAKMTEAGARSDLIEDTLRHEIAHALDFIDRGKSDHGYQWKKKCREAGADPKRTCEIPTELTEIASKWMRKCEGCGKKIFYYRKPKSRSKHGGRYIHTGCKHENNFFKVERNPAYNGM